MMISILRQFYIIIISAAKLVLVIFRTATKRITVELSETLRKIPADENPTTKATAKRSSIEN